MVGFSWKVHKVKKNKENVCVFFDIGVSYIYELFFLFKYTKKCIFQNKGGLL